MGINSDPTRTISNPNANSPDHPEDDPIVYLDSNMSEADLQARIQDAWERYGMPPDSGITVHDRNLYGVANETEQTEFVHQELQYLGGLAIAS